MELTKLKREDLKVWDRLFKDINSCGEKDFSNFVKEFNCLLTSENRHSVMMFIINKIKG
jgi:L-rhamnose mutarotase